MSGRFLIVGAGEAGVHAARALRELGHSGEILLIGAEPHRPYERPPLSKFDASGTHPDFRPIAGADALSGVDFVAGTQATAIRREDRRVMTDTGAIIAYDRLLIATGARARPLSLPAAGAEPAIRLLRTLDDAAAIRRHVRAGAAIVVIGGGLIGLELAASARTCGARVVVLEAQPSVLRRGLPPQIAERVAQRHLLAGVDIRCGVSVAGIAPAGARQIVRLAGGTALEADVVVAGAGSLPNTELAASCGLAVDDGIVVDAAMRTGDPDIFAAGDCCRFPSALFPGRGLRLESWRSAQEQGRIAAASMLGLPADAVLVPWFWSDQYDLGVQAAGLFDRAATSVSREGPAGALVVFGLASDGILVAAAGVAADTAIARDIKLAEMLIARRSRPDPSVLADPSVSLKTLLSSRG